MTWRLRFLPFPEEVYLTLHQRLVKDMVDLIVEYARPNIKVACGIYYRKVYQQALANKWDGEFIRLIAALEGQCPSIIFRIVIYRLATNQSVVQEDYLQKLIKRDIHDAALWKLGQQRFYHYYRIRPKSQPELFFHWLLKRCGSAEHLIMKIQADLGVRTLNINRAGMKFTLHASFSPSDFHQRLLCYLQADSLCPFPEISPLISEVIIYRQI